MKIIDVFICKLRKKLANVSDGKDHIKTLWGPGYVMREQGEAEAEAQMVGITELSAADQTWARRGEFDGLGNAPLEADPLGLSHQRIDNFLGSRTGLASLVELAQPVRLDVEQPGFHHGGAPKPPRQTG